ncbi:MAG: hypothetical protein HYY40_05665 [Bacteroidetes bacterium]|nr:hypothetical protein [Bacteroidota bacterium]
MVKYKYKPQISKKAFWDTEFEKLDYEKNAEAIIEAVFNYGTLDDVLEVMVCYGDDVVKQTLVNAYYLDGGARNLAHVFFNLKPTDLKCNPRKPLHFTY